MKKQITTALTIAAIAASAVLSSCSKDKTDTTLPPIGGYNSSDEIASSNLLAKFSFEGNVTDAKGNITGGAATGTSFTTGKVGNAWKGANGGYVLYTTVSDAIKSMKSVTISCWMNTVQHTDGAKSIFQLTNDSNWIGNLFFLQESGVVGNDSLHIKFTVNKWDAPAWKEQWVDVNNENRLTGVVGKWTHMVLSYDATSSMAAIYVDGVKKVLPESLTKRWGDDPTKGGLALGELKFQYANKFVFGCYKQHLPGSPTQPDGWMKYYDGGLDEFRIYNKALADADVAALFALESAGR